MSHSAFWRSERCVKGFTMFTAISLWISQRHWNMYEVCILRGEHPVISPDQMGQINFFFLHVHPYLSASHCTSLHHIWGMSSDPYLVSHHTVSTGRDMCCLRLFFLSVSLVLTLKNLTMEHTKLTQRAEVRLLCIQGKSIAEIHRELLQIHGRHSLSISTVHRWYHKFNAGDHDITQKCIGGRVSKVTPAVLDKVRGLLEEDNTMCLRVISRQTGLSLRTVHDILRNKLKLQKRPAKWIPHLLNDNQKATRLCLARETLWRFTRVPTLQDRVITGDESWFSCYEPKTKMSTRAWLGRNEARPQKCVKDRYVRKVMVIVFWDSKGVIMRDFVPDGRSVNAEYYLEVMRRLRQNIRCKRPQMWRWQNFFLHHDGAPAHRADDVIDFLRDTNTGTLAHPPYSPDLAPSDFFLFARMKRNMRGEVFSVEELRRRVDFELGQIAQWEYHHAIHDSWEKRLQSCIDSNGSYFEK